MTDPLPAGVVTLLFTDIEGSSRILEQAGPDYGRLLADHRRLLRETWATHDGVEVDTQGDAFFVAFASARSGALAAAQAHERLASHDWGGHPAVVVRIGVHTGTPERGDEGYWGADLVGTDPWIAFWLTTGLADMALDGGRPADAMPLYGRCLRWALEFDSNAGALIQACTIAQALLDLGRTPDGTLAWAVCDHVHRELGNPMRAVVDRVLATVEERIDLDLVPASRTRAAELGVAGGLAWLEEIALTDAS